MRNTNTSFLLAVLVAGGTIPAFAEDCAGLKGEKLGGEAATISDTKVVAGTDRQAEHCLVTVRINDSTLRFESRLPTSGWNGKLVFLGGGGFDGTLFDPDRPFFSASIRQRALRHDGDQRRLRLSGSGSFGARRDLLQGRVRVRPREARRLHLS